MPPVRELFVYWKVGREQGAQAAHAARSLIERLRRVHPELQCCLMRRAEGPDDRLTFMETYRCTSPGGVSAALQGAIEQAAAEALAGLGALQRHVEVFERLDPSD